MQNAALASLLSSLLTMRVGPNRRKSGRDRHAQGSIAIAVLPFVNVSADKEQGYFADGISKELLNLLAQVPGLRVIARTSSFSFKQFAAVEFDVKMPQ